MRNETTPVPGFEDEFVGTVGKEKRIHRVQWHITDVAKLSNKGYNSEYEWVKRGQKWLRLKIKENE